MASPSTTPTAAPPVPAVTPRPVLFATDFSSASKTAFAKALELARKEGAVLVIAHVYEPPADLSHSGLADDVITAEFENTIRRDVQKQLDGVLAEARAGGVVARGEILAGRPAKEIADLAETLGAAMVVVGTHGRTGIRKLVVGSVAGQIVAAAACPVLTVH
jgi:nucleotide-binding universal stress UspA family protein